MIRADISEDREATMARFLGGLNRDIQDQMDMQHYVELEEMLYKAILVKQQLKRKSNSRNIPEIRRSSHHKEEKSNYQKEFKLFPVKKEEEKSSPLFKNKEKAEATTSRARDVKCFKCQGRGYHANECTNKRVMVLLEN